MKDNKKKSEIKEKSQPSKTKISCLLGFGSILALFGAILASLWTSLFMSQYRNLMILQESSESYDIWKETPFPTYLEMYLWNITNVEDILNGSAEKIKVQQLGPYVYREYFQKANVTWYPNSTVSYNNLREWFFEPEMSNGSLEDLVTSINPIIITVAALLRERSSFIRVMADNFMKRYHDNIFLTANVSFWMFEGISDPIIDISSMIPVVNVMIPFDKFGWFYTRNGSTEFDGNLLINTGATDFEKIGNTEKWRYSDRTFYRDECGEVKGSSGELWDILPDQEEIFLFSPEICGFLTLGRKKAEMVNGIVGVVYSGNESMFDNGYNYPSKACFCDKVRDENCLPPGALNVSACRFDTPAFVTLPHMTHSDPYYPSKIEGMMPNETLTMQLIIEPTLSIPLSVVASLQINLLVRHIDGISLNNQLPDEDVLVPMFWFKQAMVIPEEFTNQAKLAINIKNYLPYGFYAMIVLGIILIIIGAIDFKRRIQK